MAAHATQYGVAVHKILLENRSVPSLTEDALMHKGVALRLLNTQLSLGMNDDGISSDINALMYTIGAIATHELNREHLESMGAADPIAFGTVMPPPSSRLRAFHQLDVVPLHWRALQKLVEGNGGLSSLQLPGMASVLALVDLVGASKSAIKPTYERHWDPMPQSFRFSTLYTSYKEVRTTPGRGFFTCVGDALPARCIAIMIRLATLNHMMCVSATQTHINITETAASFQPSLYSLQHDLLSLPSWTGLDEDEQRSSHNGVYECCRLAAIIYSNAVLMGISSLGGWHTRLTHQLRTGLEESDFLQWPIKYQGMLAWALCVGALAAPRSADHVFFEDSLRDVMSSLNKEGLPMSRKSVDELLGDYLWSEKACKHGAAMLWCALR
ncbi:hypothetical protein LTR10_006623 [Elasticomyces elasticus]|nr:hypothetical protein LTR10_006623 [Elasticomyces elasticus]KAK4972975.1 hypothetical protein LTR42_006269 [Elasticomyces elasticus]